MTIFQGFPRILRKSVLFGLIRAEGNLMNGLYRLYKSDWFANITNKTKNNKAIKATIFVLQYS